MKGTVMNSRERVLKTVNFQEPDRVPIDLGAIRASGISAVVYDAMKKRMGLNTPTKVHDSMQVLAELEMEFLDRWHIDVVPLEAATADWAPQDASEGVPRRLFCGLEVFFPPGTSIHENTAGDWLLHDSNGAAFAKMPKDGLYFDFLRTTMGDGRIDPNKFRPSGDVSDAELDCVSRHAARLYENTDKAILGWGPSISMMGLSALLSDNITQGQIDEWYCMLMMEKDTATEMMGRYADAVISRMRLYHEAIGDKVFAWGVASDDAGTQRSEIMREELFVEMIVPHYKRVCDWVHQNTNWKTFLHSCGSIYRFIPHWIEAGIDILNPVQISAANMEPARLKSEFGDRIVFWGGGCDTQRVLPRGTPDEIREHVRSNIRAFAKGGGFVFTQVHNVQQNVPPENVETMLQAAYEMGKYQPLASPP